MRIGGKKCGSAYEGEDDEESGWLEKMKKEGEVAEGRQRGPGRSRSRRQ